jgi:hypothetical protein
LTDEESEGARHAETADTNGGHWTALKSHPRTTLELTTLEQLAGILLVVG